MFYSFNFSNYPFPCATPYSLILVEDELWYHKVRRPTYVPASTLLISMKEHSAVVSCRGMSYCVCCHHHALHSHGIIKIGKI